MIDILFEVSEHDERDLIFVEVEDMDGNSVSIGRWLEEEISNGKKYQRLRITANDI